MDCAYFTVKQVKIVPKDVVMATKPSKSDLADSGQIALGMILLQMTVQLN